MKQMFSCVLCFSAIMILVLICCSACDTSVGVPALQGSVSGVGIMPSPGTSPVPTAGGPDPFQRQLLNLINTSRATAGLPPYVFSPLESSGTTSCVGSLGHSLEMSQEGAISHDQFPGDICASFTSAGENVAYTSGVSESDGITETHQAMMDEGPTGGHYQNIMSSSFTTVGVGLYVDSNGTLWLTEDFIEP